VRYAHGLAFQTEFPSAYTQYKEALAQAQVGGLANQSAGDIAEFTRVRIVLRFPDGSIAKDTTIDFPSGVNEIPVSLNIALPASVPATGVTLTGSLNYLNAAGATVWTATDVQAPVVPAAPGSTPPPPVVVVPKYVGPGATATGVRITPKTLTVNTGGAFNFSAVAVDGSGNVVPNTPIIFAAENAALVNVNAASGAGTAGNARGTTQIFARTLTNQFDAAVLTVLSPPSSIAAVSGSGQTANVGTQLTNPVVVQVNATDGQPAQGVTVAFAAQNGGVVGAATVVTGANGQASTTWRLGSTVGAQTLTASAVGLTGSPVTFTATGRAVDPVRLFFVQQPPATTAAGASLAPPITVQAVDATGAVTTAFTGTITVSLGAGAPAGAALTGSLSASAIAGVATFSDLKINLPGTYSLVASSGSLIGATSSAFAITAGAANRLIFQNYPSAGAPAGATLDPISVVVRDALNNPVTTFTGPVTLTLVGPGAVVGSMSGEEAVSTSDSLSNVLFGGPVTVNAVAGVATFSGLQITKSGSYSLSATSTGLTAATGPAFSILAGPATSILLVSGGGQSAQGAAALAAPVVVRVTDSFGNGIPGVTVNFTPAANNGTANPVSMVTIAGGTAQTNWTLGSPAGSQTLNVTSAGLTPNPLAVTATATTTAGPGPAALLAITQGPPANTTAGVAFSPIIVTAKDALNATATSFTGNVTLAITANPGGGTLSGTVTVAAVAGVATFTGLSINKVGTGYSLTASSGTLTTATTSPFNINPAAASALVIVSGNGQGGTVNTALTNPFIAKVTDNFGNAIPGVSVTWAVASGGGSLSGTTSTTNASGQVQTLLTMGAVAGANTVTATSAGLTGSPLTFTANSAPGAVTQLVFTGQPSNTTANAFSPTIVVEARDAGNNLVTSFTGGVSIQVSTNPNGATVYNGVTGVSAVAGVATFPGGVQIIKAGTGYTLTATSAGVPNGTSAAFNITAGPPLLIFADSGDAQNAVAGTPVTNKLVGRITDQYNNPVAGHTTAWSVTSGGGSLTATTNVTDAAGRVRTGWTLGGAAGPQTVQLDGLSPSIGTISFSANAGVGAATQLVFSQQPTNIVAGTAITPAPSVTAKDANGNVVTSFTSNVTLAITTNPGGGVLSGTATVAAVAGVATFPGLSVDKQGAGYGFTATSGALTSPGSASFNVSPAAAANIVAFSGNAQAGTAGAALALPFTAKVTDAFGNAVFGTNVTWAVATGGGSITPTSGTSDGNGFVSATLTLGAVAGANSATVTSAGLTGSPLTFTANSGAGAATKLLITSQPGNGVAGVALTPSFAVQAADANNNPVTSHATNVTVAITTNPGTATLSGGTIVTPTNGAAAFAVSLDKVGTGYVLTATSGGLTAAVSNAFNIGPAAAATIAVNSGNGQAGTVNTALAAPFVAKITDAFGNPVSGTNVTWNVTTGGGSLAGTTTVSNAAGLVQATLTMGNVAGLNEATVTSAGLSGSPLTFMASSAAGTATKLVFLTQPSNVVAGSAFGAHPVVQVQDAFNNPVTTYATDISLAITTNPGGATLSGTTSVAPVTSASTFTGLSLNKTGVGYVLTASSGGLATAVSNAFNVTPAAAAAIVVDAGDAQTGVAGAALANPFVARVNDALGNAVPGASVTWAVATGGGSLGGTISTTDAAGKAQTTLTLGVAVGSNTVTATSAGLTGSPLTFNATGTAGTATKLVFSTQPTNAVAGVNLSPAPVVQAQDANNNVVTSYTAPNIVVTISTNPGSATLGGTTSLAPTSGQSAFSTLNLNKIGTGYVLTATSGSLTAAVSNGFNITAAAAATIVADSGQAQSALAGAALANKIVGRVSDAFGNPVAGVSVTWGTPTLGGSLSGQTATTDANGFVKATWTLGAAGPQSVTLTSAGLGGSPITFTATGNAANASAVWTGAQDAVWTNPNNWSPAIVPGVGDSLLIQAGGTNPSLSANTTVKSVYIANGATLNTSGFTLTVTGNMSAGNTIVGHVTLTGTGTMQGHVTGNVNVTGTYTVVGPDSVGGSLTVGGSGSLTIGAHTVGVAGHFSTATNGVLVMTTPSGILSVGGDVGFGGGNNTLTDGLVQLKGHFLGASGFVPTANHQTWFIGGAQDVTLSGAIGTNRFNTVLFNSGTVTAQTHLVANAIHLGVGITNLNAVNAGISARVRDSILDPNDRWNIPTVVFTGPSVKIGNQLAGATLVRFVSGVSTALLATSTDSLKGTVNVDSSTVLQLGAHVIKVKGDFVTMNSGGLGMANASGSLSIIGNATFGGGASNLIAGTITVAGNLTQSGATQSYRATGLHTTTLSGGGNQTVSFASPDTGVVACALSCFHKLQIVKSGGTVTFDSPVRIGDDFSASAGVTAVTAVGTAGNPRNVVIGGPNPSAGNMAAASLTPGALHFSRLAIKGVPGIGGGTVDSIEFFGPTVAAGTFNAVKVTGAGSLSGTMSAQSLVVTGALTMNGKRANVSGHFGTVATGFLTMNNAADSLLVAGNVTFSGGNSNLSAGLITVGGDFAQAGATTNAFAASTSHLVKFNGSGNQVVALVNPDLVEVPPNASSCSLSCFANVDINKSAGKVNFSTGAKMLGGLTLTNAPDSVTAYGKRIIVGGNFVPTAVTGGARIGLLSVGGTAANTGPLMVDTLIHWGTADVEIAPVVSLQIWGTNAIKGSARNFLGNVALFGSGTLSFQAGSTVINGGFSTNGGTNTFTMVHDSVNVVVSGAVNLASGAASTPAAGHLHMSGNFTTNGTAFQATGTHVTHFTAQTETSQTITGSTPVASQGLRHVMFEGGGSKVISGSLNITGNVTIDGASPAVTGVGATVFIGGDFSDATQKDNPALRTGSAQLRATDPRAARANAIATYSRRRAAMRAAEASAPRVMAPSARAPRSRTKAPAVRAVAPTPAMLAAAAAVPPVSLVDPLGGWQVENTTFAGSSLNAQVMTTNLTITGQASLSNWMEINGDVVVQKVSGSPGQLVFNGKELVVSGNFSTAASGTIKLIDGNDGLFVGGNATFGGGSTAGLLTSGYLEVVGSFTQNGSNEAFMADATFDSYIGYIEYGCEFCEFRANARAPRPALRAGMMANDVMPSSISFANPGEGAGTSHFGMLYLQGLEIDLQSDVYALATLETGESSSIHVSTSTPTKKIVSHGADVRNLSFDNVRWELLDGHDIWSLDDVTFGTMDPAVDQFTITRNGALPPLCDCTSFQLWYWSFNTVPTTGTYIKATDTDGATSGTLRIRMQNPNPTIHDGKISFNGGAELQNWLTSWVWTGAFNTNWTSPGNWGTLNSYPDYSSDVTIPSGTPNAPRLTNHESVRNLTIATGASLELSGYSLAVHGNLSGPTATAAVTCDDCDGLGEPVRLVGTGGTFTASGKFLGVEVGDVEFGAVDYRIGGGSTQLIAEKLVIRNGNFSVNGGTLSVNSELTTESSGRLVMTNVADQVTVSGKAQFYGASETTYLTAGTMTLNNILFEANTEMAPDAFAATGTHKVILTGTSSVNFYTGFTTMYFNDLTVDAASSTTFNSDLHVIGTFRRAAGAGGVTLAGDLGNTRILYVNGIDVGAATTMNSVAVRMENAGTFTAFNNVTFSGFNAFTGSVLDIARAGSTSMTGLNFTGTLLGLGGFRVENSGTGAVNISSSFPAPGILNTDYKITGTGTVSWTP
jgi:hypothetical protein